MKLAVLEPETGALEADVLNRDGLLTSYLGAAEVRRAARHAGHRRVIQRVDEVLEAFVLVEMTTAIVERSSGIATPELRTLDAIHLATAISLDVPDLTFITYDPRLAAAARACGLSVAQPGRRAP